MKKILISLIILLIIVLLIVPKREAMTRIRRGVGFLNDADEWPVAAGIIHSAPILDYTYTFWDGAKHASCDECPNEIVCPKCPQWAVTDHFNLAVGGHDDGAKVVDFDDEYAHSREKLGAVSAAVGLHSSRMGRDGAADYREKLVAADDKFDCKLINLGGYSQRGAWSRGVNDFLYGCDVAHANQDDCVFYNNIGLQYKEPCQYSTHMISTLSQ